MYFLFVPVCLSFMIQYINPLSSDPPPNSKQYQNRKMRTFGVPCGETWVYLAEHHQSRGLDGGSPPFKIAYGKCICPFPNCPRLLEWGARQPAGTALVYVHNIVCSLHICAVSCVSVVRIYNVPVASDRWCADYRTFCWWRQSRYRLVHEWYRIFLPFLL